MLKNEDLSFQFGHLCDRGRMFDLHIAQLFLDRLWLSRSWNVCFGNSDPARHDPCTHHRAPQVHPNFFLVVFCFSTSILVYASSRVQAVLKQAGTSILNQSARLAITKTLGPTTFNERATPKRHQKIPQKSEIMLGYPARRTNRKHAQSGFVGVSKGSSSSNGDAKDLI
jgi:hypothetical protein